MVLEKVTIVGSGNWGSAISKIVGNNVIKFPSLFDPIIRMWVYEEKLADGRLLSQVINNDHENVKYLPGIILPQNVLAVTDLAESVKDSTLLVFVTPHQFVKGICKQLKGKLSPNARGISLIKGVQVESNCGLKLISDILENELNIDISVLMGANIANEVAQEQFCESTLGYRNLENAQIFKKLFHTFYFKLSLVQDVVGVELCGALKNIIALAAGFIDGLGLGENTKAAVVRIGLVEMKNFCQSCLDEKVKESTFWESCGFADLLTTCYGGRNRKVAEAFVKTGKSIDQLEEEMLNGQKLQGPPAAREVFRVLKNKNLLNDFPLLDSIYKICFEGLPPKYLIESLQNSQ